MGHEVSDDDDDVVAIEDNYDGIDLKGGKGAGNEFAEPEPMILGDDFLADLRGADVPDSDDECYF